MRRSLRTTAVVAALGAAIAYLFDRDDGRRRRAMARDRATATFSRASWIATGRGRAVAARGRGLTEQATHLRDEPKDLDDITLARKVESIAFRPADAPKGDVNVQVVDGVVELRGELPDQAAIDRLVDTARGVDGVRDVHSLLHTPGSPVPAG